MEYSAWTGQHTIKHHDQGVVWRSQRGTSYGTGGQANTEAQVEGEQQQQQHSLVPWDMHGCVIGYSKLEVAWIYRLCTVFTRCPARSCRFNSTRIGRGPHGHGRGWQEKEKGHRYRYWPETAAGNVFCKAIKWAPICSVNSAAGVAITVWLSPALHRKTKNNTQFAATQTNLQPPTANRAGEFYARHSTSTQPPPAAARSNSNQPPPTATSGCEYHQCVGQTHRCSYPLCFTMKDTAVERLH